MGHQVEQEEAFTRQVFLEQMLERMERLEEKLNQRAQLMSELAVETSVIPQVDETQYANYDGLIEYGGESPMLPYMESHECTYEDLRVLAPNSSKKVIPDLPIEEQC